MLLELNTIHPTINFTIEYETDKKVNFLQYSGRQKSEDLKVDILSEIRRR
jgi:hypothetical protein